MNNLDKINVRRMALKVQKDIESMLDGYVSSDINEETCRNITTSVYDYMNRLNNQFQVFRNNPPEIKCFNYVSYIINRKNKVEMRTSDGRIELLKRRFRSRRIANLAAKKAISSSVFVDLVISPPMPVNYIKISIPDGQFSKEELDALINELNQEMIP